MLNLPKKMTKAEALIVKLDIPKTKVRRLGMLDLPKAKAGCLAMLDFPNKAMMMVLMQQTLLLTPVRAKKKNVIQLVYLLEMMMKARQIMELDLLMMMVMMQQTSLPTLAHQGSKERAAADVPSRNDSCDNGCDAENFASNPNQGSTGDGYNVVIDGLARGAERNRGMNKAIEELHWKGQAADTIQISASASDNVASNFTCQGIEAAAGGGKTVTDSGGNKEACSDKGTSNTGLLPDDVSTKGQMLSNNVKQQQLLTLLTVKPSWRSPRKKASTPLEKIVIAYRKNGRQALKSSSLDANNGNSKQQSKKGPRSQSLQKTPPVRLGDVWWSSRLGHCQ